MAPLDTTLSFVEASDQLNRPPCHSAYQSPNVKNRVEMEEKMASTEKRRKVRGQFWGCVIRKKEEFCLRPKVCEKLHKLAITKNWFYKEMIK
jgi:hypothetical protein